MLGLAGRGSSQQDDGRNMNHDTLLHRQVNPRWIRDGAISSQTFTPTRKDAGLLSVYDGDQIAAEAAWSHFTDSLGFTSAGVVAVSVLECQDLQLPVRPDPTPFPEHAVIDFTGLSRSGIERKADRLKMAALARGWLFRTDDI